MKVAVLIFAMAVLITFAQEPKGSLEETSAEEKIPPTAEANFTEEEVISEEVEIDSELPPLEPTLEEVDDTEDPIPEELALIEDDFQPEAQPIIAEEDEIAPLNLEEDLSLEETEIDTLPPLISDDETVTTIDALAPITVQASSTSTSGSAFHVLPTETIQGEELSRLAQGTLGDTLGWQVGVNASSYGQGASRPIIRGFDGYRVKLLRDSVGTMDASDISPDHGLPIEPLLLRKVEILRGPAALIYGNSALGGAVNSTTRGFATEIPDRTWSGAYESRWDSTSSGWTNAAYLDLALEDFVFSFTGSYRDVGNIGISGNARTSSYDRLVSPVVNDPTSGTTVPIVNPSGTLPNSALQSSSYSLGLSWLPETLPLEASLAFSHFESEYGLPFLFAGDANDLFGDTSLDLEQDRLDLRLKVRPEQPWLEEATLHFGYGDYHHTEQFRGRDKDAGTNFDDTRFDLKSWEIRLDLIHEPTEWLRGIAGVQIWSRSLEPSFLAAAPRLDSRFFQDFETTNFGAFIKETATLGDFEVNAALRWETQTIKDLSSAASGFTRGADDTSISAILGGNWESETLEHLDRLKLSLNGSFIERIPTEVERFAFWRNPGIQRFLVGGDLDGSPLETEQAFSIDLGIEADLDNFSLKLNSFFYHIDNFIFLEDTRSTENIATFKDLDSEFYGIEAQLDWDLYDDEESELTLSLMGDWIRARDQNASNSLPRIPPLRLGSRLHLKYDDLVAGLEIRHAFSKNTRDVAPDELPTDGYTEVNMDLSYVFELQNENRLTLFLKAQNLLDEERRLHTSFLKDVAPLSGRNFTLGARLEF